MFGHVWLCSETLGHATAKFLSAFMTIGDKKVTPRIRRVCVVDGPGTNA